MEGRTFFEVSRCRPSSCFCDAGRCVAQGHDRIGRARQIWFKPLKVRGLQRGRPDPEERVLGARASPGQQLRIGRDPV
jgi:hypothetical protein